MNFSIEYEYSLKLLLLGDSCVGKSNFIFWFINHEFNGQHFTSSGIELKNTELVIDKNKIQLQIWDTAGQEKYKAVTKSLFSKVQGFIAIFDLTKEETFINIKTWITLIKAECGHHTPILLVGNKNDLKDLRDISDEDIKKYCDEEKLEFIKTSSKTGENINKAINMICEKILEEKDETLEKNFSFTLDSSIHSEKRKKYKCCQK